MKNKVVIILIFLFLIISCDRNKTTVEPEIPKKDTSAKIVFNMVDEVGWGNQIYRMNIDGSDLTQLTFSHEILDTLYDHGWSSSYKPTWSSDGKKILYKRSIGLDEEHAVMMDEDGTNKKIVSYGIGYTAFAMWSPSDNSYIVDCTTTSRRVLVDTLGNRHEISYPEYPFVLNGDSIYSNTGDIGWTPYGYTIYIWGAFKRPAPYRYCGEDSTAELFRMDLITGNLTERITYNNIDECSFSPSPDGKILLFSRGDYRVDQRLYIMGINDSTLVPITDGTLDHYPNWSNRSDVIIYLQDIDPDKLNTESRLSIIDINEPFNPKVVIDKPIHNAGDLYFNE